MALNVKKWDAIIEKTMVHVMGRRDVSQKQSSDKKIYRWL